MYPNSKNSDFKIHLWPKGSERTLFILKDNDDEGGKSHTFVLIDCCFILFCFRLRYMILDLGISISHCPLVVPFAITMVQFFRICILPPVPNADPMGYYRSSHSLALGLWFLGMRNLTLLLQIQILFCL